MALQDVRGFFDSLIDYSDTACKASGRQPDYSLPLTLDHLFRKAQQFVTVPDQPAETAARGTAWEWGKHCPLPQHVAALAPIPRALPGKLLLPPGRWLLHT